MAIRTSRQNEGEKLDLSKPAFVYGGGGAKSAFQAGFAEAVARDIPASIITATSGGALVGLLHAQGEPEEAMRLFHSLREKDLLSGGSKSKMALKLLKPWGRKPLSFYDTRKLRRVIEANVDPVKLSRGPVFAVTATHYKTGGAVHADLNTPVFTHTEIVDWLMATSAMPVLFPPSALGGMIHYDGGVRENVPLKIAFRYEPSVIIVVMTGQLDRAMSYPSPDSPIDVLKWTIDTMMHEALVNDVKGALASNETIRHFGQDGRLTRDRGNTLRHFDIIIVEPWRDLGGVLDFDKKTQDARIAMGVETGRRLLDMLKKEAKNGTI